MFYTTSFRLKPGFHRFPFKRNRLRCVHCVNDKKDGYRQLNVRQLGSLYAPGTIAVNVTWIEREFNACQTPRSMYPSIYNHF